jgi:glucuronoarabinoxylan endo-1,4-beta-xylanase
MSPGNKGVEQISAVKRIGSLLGLAALLAVAVFLADRGQPDKQIANVNWAELHQTIDGFGASSADFLIGLTPAQADFFFTTSGIGLSILRTQIIPDLTTCDAEFHKGGCSSSNGQILDGELGTAQLAVARGAMVFSTPWSPPGTYKSNGSFKNGGYLLFPHYADWATSIATYVTMMARNGVPIFAVSVQNEPDVTAVYGSCRYSAQQIHDFIPYLSSALKSAGVSATKIMIAEESSWSLDSASVAMADPRVAPKVGILAAHAYSGIIRTFHTGRARLWQTEVCSPSQTYDGSMRDGMYWARKIHSYLATANVNAWIWFFLTDMPKQGEGTDNGALTDINGNYPKRTYVTGQWSKFVRPGWSRIGVHYFGRVQVTAFKDPAESSFAIVAVNFGKNAVTETFSLSGVSANSVVPWITSESLSLAAQAPIRVENGQFTSILPPLSVTTFSGQSVPAS